MTNEDAAIGEAEIIKRTQELTLRKLELQRLQLEQEIARLAVQTAQLEQMRRLAEVGNQKPGFINYITQREYKEAVFYPFIVVLGFYGVIGIIVLALAKLSKHGWL